MNDAIGGIGVNSKSWDNGHKSGNEKIETGMVKGFAKLKHKKTG